MPDATRGPLRKQAREVAALIAERMADPQAVADAVAASRRRSRYPFDWGGASLHSGHAGSALLFRGAARARSDDADRWRTLAHEHLVHAVRSTHAAPLGLTAVGDGTAGLALAMADGAADDPRYRRALRDLHGRLATQVLEAADWRRPDDVADADYDVVRGAAGVLGYLASVADPGDLVRQAVARLVDDLTWLCTPGPDRDRPPWTVPPRHYPMPEYLEWYPHGYVNLGLAHGIPGPLAALCHAWRSGYRRPGMREAIGYVARYLTGAATVDGYGSNWPAGVPLDSSGAEVRDGLGNARTAWCYGAPGICSALLDAADALGDDRLRAFAVEAFGAALRRLRDHDEGSATLCHGLAGMLAISARLARDAGCPDAGAAVTELTAAVLAHCDPALPLVVRDLEPPDVHLDSPGLLSGATGVALALWSVSAPGPARWKRALLIS